MLESEYKAADDDDSNWIVARFMLMRNGLVSPSGGIAGGNNTTSNEFA